MSKGWVKIHRDIQDHWIFDNSEYLRAWIILLMVVNHKPSKSLIKGRLLECQRGESLLSHASWAAKFGKNWNRQKVIRFFKLLENDKMIEQVNEQVTTHLKVSNYAQYQDNTEENRTPNRTGDDTPDEHQANTKRTGDDTQLKNVKNVKNDKKKEDAHSALAETLGVDVGLIEKIIKHRRDIKSPANTDKKISIVVNDFKSCVEQGLCADLNQAMDRLDKTEWKTLKPEYINKSSGNNRSKPNVQNIKDQFMGQAVLHG